MISSSSMSNKSLDEFKQLNESVPELFRLSAKVQLAETISFISPVPAESVEILVNSCLSLLPSRRYTKVSPDDGALRAELSANPTIATSLISIRSQESTIALSHLYKCANGVIGDKENVVPILTSFMMYLTYTDLQTTSDVENAQNFTRYLVGQLALLTHITPVARDIIVPDFIEFFAYIVQSHNIPIIYGTLLALGDSKSRFLYQQDELARVINVFDSLMEVLPEKNTKLNQKKCLLLICRAFEQITRLPQDQVESDTYKRLYKSNVLVGCGILDASIGKEVAEYIIRFMLDTKMCPDSEVVAALNRPHSEALYSAMLSALVELADKYPDRTTRIIEVLKDFISTSPVPKHNDVIRNRVFDSVCKILKNEQQKERGFDVCKTVISSLINTLHTHYSNYTSGAIESVRLTRSPSVLSIQNDTLSNLIICLGRITCTLNDPNITEIVLPNFMSRVTYPPNYIENLILEQLTDIALLGHPAITKDIVVLITNLFKKIYKDPNQGIITNITPLTLQRLAKDLTSEELRHDLCKRVLKLFQQLGKTIKREELEQNISSPILKGMGFLLPTIAELVKGPPIPELDAINGGSDSGGNTRLFRTVWFYCVLFKFSVSGTWRSDWRECVQVMAAHLVPLISTKTHIYLEMELELDSIIRQGFEKEYFLQLKNTLLDYLPGHAHFIKNLTHAQLAYVYAVYTLETMRFTVSRSFKVIFSYLEDQGIDNLNVSACVRAIADRVFTEYLGIYSTISPTVAEKVLAPHAAFLLVKFCYPFEPVRKAADEWISSTVAKFPQILWNKQCLSTLLDLLDVIGQAARAKPMDLISIRLPSTDDLIELPDETPARIRLLQDVVALGNVWLKNGVAVAPVEIQEQLQEYMQRFTQLSGQNHIGFSLAVEIGSIDNAAPVAAPSQLPICYNSNAASFVITLQLKALYAGEVNGMMNMIMADEFDSADDERTSDVVEELAFLRLIEEFERMISQHKQGKVSVDARTFSSLMYRSCAFLINHYFGQSVKLIHLVCYAPALLFTPEAMHVGVSSWKWLLAERPDLTTFIMTSIGDIWAWTVNQRIGLFSNTERDASPLAISATTSSEPRDAPTPQERHNHVPHRIMIEFLEERFSVVRYSSSEQISILAGMLQKAIADPMMLSVAPRSLGTRFMLLLLCMRFIQGDHIPDPSLVALMRERVYLAALSWFYLSPVWYGANESSGQLEADTRLLINFCKSLQSEPIFANYDKRFTIGSFAKDRGSFISSTPLANNSATTNSIRNGRPSSDRLNGTMSMSPPNHQHHNSQSFHTSQADIIMAIKMDVVGSGIGTMSSTASHTVSAAFVEAMRADRPVGDTRLDELRRQRNLILLLVGNELERMSAWNNPINRLSLQVPEQLKFSYDNLPKGMKSSWKEYLVAAWRINPRLAIHFGSRFPQAKIRRILSEMVVRNTKSVLGIAEALPLLVTQENVRANIPELKYLLYWETVTPPVALQLLGREYQPHALVAQYACRVLRAFPPEAIMFYIPQLVQALRYDRTGLVENYLVAASKTSELLAHQIIWNVLTYTEADPNTGKMIEDPGIADVARRLRDRITAAMDTQIKVNYDKEFEFFESFTAISGRLLQLKDPTKRKGHLHDELKTLAAQNNNSSELYLPTNPKNLVVGVEIESAMTLQSAAKVPILVNFKVIERTLPVATPAHIDAKSPSPSNSPPMGVSSSSMSIPPPAKLLAGPTGPKLTASQQVQGRDLRQRKPSKRLIKASDSNKEPIVKIQGCIFKSGDDIRQDMLALQVIDLFKRIFNSAGLDLYLFPYKVIATKPGCGMIELCPNTMSRDQIGKKVNGTLYNYFISKYGPKNSVGFQNARKNFIKSMAAYSVVSYILQIKDRHNANILVDEEGHIVHIDFGFIFDISPGGELLTFEASPFKMSQEMIDIMGGKPNAEQFTWFMEQSVRAFLAARQHMDSIMTLVELMLDTKLPCFREHTLLNLKNRFCPHKSDNYAAKFMTKVVLDSFSTVSTFSTYFYDVFQYYDNGIEM
eukprot:gene9767-11405_t